MVNYVRTRSRDSLRISDPEMKDVLDRIVHNIVNDREAATAFLRRVGVLPPIGPLEERYS